MGKSGGHSTALLVVGVIQLLLTLSLFGVCIWTQILLPKELLASDYLTLGSYGASALYLTVSILAIATGKTGRPNLHVATIVCSVLAIIAALATTISSVVLMIDLFHLLAVFGDVLINVTLYKLRLTLLAINGASFLLLITLSCLACFGRNRNQVANVEAEANSKPGPQTKPQRQPQTQQSGQLRSQPRQPQPKPQPRSMRSTRETGEIPPGYVRAPPM